MFTCCIHDTKVVFLWNTCRSVALTCRNKRAMRTWVSSSSRWRRVMPMVTKPSVRDVYLIVACDECHFMMCDVMLFLTVSWVKWLHRRTRRDWRSRNLCSLFPRHNEQRRSKVERWRKYCSFIRAQGYLKWCRRCYSCCGFASRCNCTHTHTVNNGWVWVCLCWGIICVYRSLLTQRVPAWLNREEEEEKNWLRQCQVSDVMCLFHKIKQ